jgi:hypothetical protein
MMFITLQLLVIMTLLCAVQGQCDSLTITDSAGQQINTSTHCVKVYNTTECLPFYESFNRSDLPEGYPNQTKSVEKPEDIALDGLYSEHEGYIYPGISVMWKNPFSEDAKSKAIGYLVAWYDKNIAKNTKCRLFHMETGNSMKLQFRYNVAIVEPASNYVVRVYSMPTPVAEYKDNENAFVYQHISTYTSYKSGEPGEWGPSVMYTTLKNGTINMRFTLAPADFNITSFTVHLTRDTDKMVPVYTTQVTTGLRTEQNTQFAVPLSVRESGSYNIIIWANDDDHMNFNRCRCWIINESHQKTCKNICGGTSTEYFYVNITEPPILVTTEPPILVTTEPPILTTTESNAQTTDSISKETEDPTTESWVEPNPDSLKYILGAVFACLALFFLVVAVYMFRRRDRVKKFIPHWLCYSSDTKPGDEKPFPGTFTFKDGTFKDAPIVPSLKRKTVYLMSAGDHQAHTELVDSFINFLEVHCHCDVIMPSETDQREHGTYAWFLKMIGICDYIIFFNSVGAMRLIEAHISQKTYSKKMSAEDEIFDIGLKHIILNAVVRDKQLILVSFQGNQCQLYLHVPETYMLPKKLPRLLQKIHGLNAEATRQYSGTLPLNDKIIQELTEGATMAFCWKEVEAYEKNNPNWLEDSFGDLYTISPEHSYTRTFSYDSGCQSMTHDPLDSVSRQFTIPESPKPGHLVCRDMNLLAVTEVKKTENGLCDERNKPTGDEFSCITISDEQSQTLPPRQTLADDYSLIPPDSASKIDIESYSMAMDLINSNNAVPRYPHSISYTDTLLDNHIMDIDEDFQARIIPPDNLSDINVESISSALADINENSRCIVFKGITGQSQQDSDNGYFEPEFDSVSI